MGEVMRSMDESRSWTDAKTRRDMRLWKRRANLNAKPDVGGSGRPTRLRRTIS